MHNENRFLDTFRGHNIQPTSHAGPVPPGTGEYFSTSCTSDRLPKMCKTSNEKLININPSNENVGSGFFTSLNSLPNEKRFKMAFLNIVSLPRKIDEIRYSLSNKSKIY